MAIDPINVGFTANNPLNSMNNLFGDIAGAAPANTAVAVPSVPGTSVGQAPTGFSTTDSFDPSKAFAFDPSKQEVKADAYNVPSTFVQGAQPGSNSITTSGEKAVATVRVGSKATGTGAHATNSLADIDKANQAGAAQSPANSALTAPTNSPAGASKDVQAGAPGANTLEGKLQEIIAVITKLLQDLGLGGAPANGAAQAGAPGAPKADPTAQAGAPKAPAAPAPAPAPALNALKAPTQAGAAGQPGDLQALIAQISQAIQGLIAQLTAQGNAPAAAGMPKAA